MEKMTLPDIYHERLRIFENAVALRAEGRICIAPQLMYLPIYLYGETTVRETMLDYRKALPSWLRYHREYQPDMYWGVSTLIPLRPLETLDCRYVRWPGRHVGENEPFQVLDHEFMTAEEYLEYAEDPTGFMLRKILPRHYKELEGLQMVDLSAPVFMAGLYGMLPFALPPVRHAVQKMTEAGEQMLDYAAALGEFDEVFAKEGWPNVADYFTMAPFDIFNDLLRGLINATMDTLTCPDEMLLAIQAATRIQVRTIKAHMQRNPQVKSVFFFLHNGTDIFMSPAAFEKFYWPGLKACMDAVIEMGGIPRVYTEEKMDQKLDILADVPKGKVVYHLVNTDLRKAKQKLGGIACLSGGIDGVMLNHGTEAQVERNVRETLDVMMDGGGYILDTSVPLDVAKPENLRIMFDTALKYGTY